MIRSTMFRRSALAAAAISLSLSALAAGCGSDVKLVAASGKVSLDGAPLEGATLSFIPLPGNAVSTAGTDVSGPSGNFQMTYGGRSGLAPGKYKVSVSKTTEIAPPKGKEVSPIFAKASVEKGLMGLTKEAIPPQNFDREIEVPEGGATDFALDFKSKGKTK